MPAIKTNSFKLHNAEQFYESISEAEPSRLFIFVGKSLPYANDTSPDTPTDSVGDDLSLYRNMIAMKRIQASDVTYAIPRYNWVNNSIYKQYDHSDTSLWPTSSNSSSNNTFYVVTTDRNVYKVIDNNRGGASTVKPTGTGTSITITADNYRWKYLYTISVADYAKFATSGYIPVKHLTANDGSSQWAVQVAASNGAINHIQVLANGSSYLWTSNTFASVTNSTVVKLANNALGNSGIYNYSSLYISQGLGAGQIRRIISYNGTTRNAVINTAFTTSPNTSSRYIIGPNVIIRGDSGTLTSTRATAYVANCHMGKIRKVTMISEGLNYSYANVSLGGNSSFGSGASLKAIISPKGGHGSNPRNELGGKNVMVSMSLQGSESNTFPTNNHFRTVGIIADPLLRSGPVANASVIDLCGRLDVNIVTGDFVANEYVSGGTSGAKGRVVYFANSNAARTKGYVKINLIETAGIGKFFSAGETITGNTSGITANLVSYYPPAVKEYTGSVIYTENRLKISRAPDQTEVVKVIIGF